MYGHLIALDKLPRLRPVGVVETWCQLFAKFVLKVTGPEATHGCKDGHLCVLFKVVINGSLHGVQYIWDANFTKENQGFLLVDSNNAFNWINRIGMLWMVGHLWPSGAHFFLTAVVTIPRLS